jgi:hypothetical protein
MAESDTAIEKLRRIQELWTEVGRTRLDTPKYKTLMIKIRILSSEYQELLEASNNPHKSN